MITNPNPILMMGNQKIEIREWPGIFYAEKPRTEIGDLGSKLAAQILLADRHSGIVIPSKEEWIGFNLLERDDELFRRE